MTRTTARSCRAAAPLVLALLLGGCEDDKWGSGVDTDDPGTVTTEGDGGEEDCGPNPPVIEGEPWCEYSYEKIEGNPQSEPVLKITAYTTDVDGDLHIRAVRMWFDGEPLGEIDTETAAFKEKDRTQATDRPCTTYDGTPNDKWVLYEGRVEYGAMYDWGISVQDAAGNWSEMAITQCPAPTAEGTKP